MGFDQDRTPPLTKLADVSRFTSEMPNYSQVARSLVELAIIDVVSDDAPEGDAELYNQLASVQITDIAGRLNDPKFADGVRRIWELDLDTEDTMAEQVSLNALSWLINRGIDATINVRTSPSDIAPFETTIKVIHASHNVLGSILDSMEVPQDDQLVARGVYMTPEELKRYSHVREILLDLEAQGLAPRAIAIARASLAGIVNDDILSNDPVLLELLGKSYMRGGGIREQFMKVIDRNLANAGYDAFWHESGEQPKSYYLIANKLPAENTEPAE